jgi:hypothetical protein
VVSQQSREDVAEGRTLLHYIKKEEAPWDRQKTSTSQKPPTRRDKMDSFLLIRPDFLAVADNMLLLACL